MDPSLMRRSEYRGRITDIEVRDSGSPDVAYTVSGHAAVFNSLSLDLGGFREKIDEGAFDDVLARGPSVLAVWDHDTRWIIGNTENDTLDLSVDAKGLRFFSRVPPTDYAAELRILLERGYITQCSFMFTIADERYEIVGEGDREMVVFTIEEIGELYDVSVCGRGAYPQTDVSLAMARAARREHALELRGVGSPDGRAPTEDPSRADDGGEDGSVPAETDPAVAESERVRKLALARVHVGSARKP